MVDSEGLAFEGSPGVATGELSRRDRAILDFERDWTRRAGAKEDIIRSRFNLSAARYYQVLNAVIDSPDALAYDPLLVTRLQRVRAARVAARTLEHDHIHNPSSQS